MNFESIILGFVQGATEFIPVSSSGHTFLLKEYFGIDSTLFLETWMHLASLLAVIIFFRKKIYDLIVGFFKVITKRTLTPDGVDALKIITATIFTFPTVYILDKVFSFEEFLTETTVAITLIATGILIIVAEKAHLKKADLTWTLVILLGLVQGLAVIPGISRSGLTISFLIFMGLAKQKSAEFSFLLAVPTILGAFILKYVQLDNIDFLSRPEMWYMFAASFIASVLSIKYMMKLVSGKWIYFAPYCFLVGGLILAI
jgi:undecaprenyl-diphosphatase